MRAQISIETLAVYGFSLLVILVAVAAISYAGLGSFGLKRSICQFPKGLDCIGQPSLMDDKIEIALKNNKGTDIDILDASIDICSSSKIIIENTDYMIPTEIEKEAIFIVSFENCSLEEKIDVNPQIEYMHKMSGITHTETGHIKT